MLNDGKCHCDMRTKMVGDGCPVCNPEYAADHMGDDKDDMLTDERIMELRQKHNLAVGETFLEHRYDDFEALVRSIEAEAMASMEAEIARLKEDVEHYKYQAHDAGLSRVRIAKQAERIAELERQLLDIIVGRHE